MAGEAGGKVEIALAGKVALVTGGGRGIGAATARLLAAAGARVIVSARSADEIETVAEEIRGSGGLAEAVPCDIADPAAITRLRAAAEARFGTVDILIANAGIASSAPLARVGLEEWNRLFTVNATGPFLCAQAFVPGMVARCWGRIVNIASNAGVTGYLYSSAYCAAKHALVGMTRALATELGRTGVTINAVCPGWVDTPLLAPMDPTLIAGIVMQIPRGRLATADELAELVRFLAGPDSSYCNGDVFAASGGFV